MQTTGNVSYKTRSHIIYRRSRFFIVPLAFILAFAFAACGSNGGTTTGAPGSTPTTVPTPMKTTGPASTTSGCPNNAVVTSSQGKPNVILHLTNANGTTSVHNGDLIEILLPFGQQWAGPTTSQGVLKLQTPSGYSSPAEKMCVWHFVAQGTGTIQLNFTSRAICKLSQLCPQYILDVPFTIDVK